MDVIAAYRECGHYRGAAEMCGTTHKTVKRIVRARTRPVQPAERQGRGHNYDQVAELVAAAGGEDAGPDLGEAVVAGGAGGRLCRVGRGTSAGWSPRRRRRGGGIITGAAGRGCGRRVRR